ncbi:MAG TPA: type II secretion system F family protein [Terriglobia bacterium]|jgi:tight adherence protein B|nr:type II secretion system F family protein [Terriglobia bacterium]
MALALAGLTFLVIVLIVGGVLFASVGGRAPDKVVAKRLEAIERSAKRGNETLELKVVRDELLSDVPALHRILLKWKWSDKLRDFISQAGMKVKPGRLILLSAVIALGAYVIVNRFSASNVLGLVALPIGALIPISVVAFKRRRRLKAFEKIFPEAIDLLGRAVRAGHSFSTGLEMITTELPEPVAGEFRTTFEEQNFGLPLRDALLNLSERIPLIDVRFFVTAVLIQKETGGNLAEILDNLAHVVRERFRILGEVRVKTAQGRLTAAILISLPPIMAVVLRGLNPSYMSPLFNDPLGPYVIGLAAFLQIVGSLMLWKIVNIEV